MRTDYFQLSLSMIRLLCAAVGLSSFSGIAIADTLSLTIDNIQAATGKILISVGNATAFDGKSSYALQIILPARAGRVTFSTDALPAGTWAARVLHDINDNNEMDSNMVGMPKEPWGMSNNARGKFGPPTFEDARFELKGDTALTIRVEK